MMEKISQSAERLASESPAQAPSSSSSPADPPFSICNNRPVWRRHSYSLPTWLQASRCVVVELRRRGFGGETDDAEYSLLKTLEKDPVLELARKLGFKVTEFDLPPCE